MEIRHVLRNNKSAYNWDGLEGQADSDLQILIQNLPSSVKITAKRYLFLLWK